MLIEHAFGEIHGRVAAGVNIGACQRDCFVRPDADAFESNAAGGAIVKFTNIKNATVGQCMPVSNREHTATRLRPDYARAILYLQRGDQNLRSARRVLTREYN